VVPKVCDSKVCDLEVCDSRCSRLLTLGASLGYCKKGKNSVVKIITSVIRALFFG